MFVCLFNIEFFLQGGQQCWALWAFLAACPYITYSYSIMYVCLLIGRIKMLACLLVKILERNSKGFYVIMQVKWKRGIKNWRFSTSISLCFGNDTRYDTAIVTMEDDLSNYAIFSQPSIYIDGC